MCMARMVFGRTGGERESGRSSLEAIMGIYEDSCTSYSHPLWLLSLLPSLMILHPFGPSVDLHLKMMSDLILSPFRLGVEGSSKVEVFEVDNT